MESEWVEKLEKYLGGEMAKEEKALFEAELSSNEELKSFMKLYSSVEEEMRSYHSNLPERNELKKNLDELGDQYFHSTTTSSTKSTKTVQLYFSQLLKAAMTMAASWIFILVVSSSLILGTYFAFFHESFNPRLMAEDYMDSNLSTLGQSMGSPDRMQLGIEAYGQKRFNDAIAYFEEVLAEEPQQEEALKNVGLSYLAKKDFENALLYFEKLENLRYLETNEGKFLKALTLMIRDEREDRSQAKILLEEVVQQDAFGSKQAKVWLEEFD